MTEQRNEHHDNPSRMHHAYSVQDGPQRRMQRGYQVPQPPPQYQVLQERQQPMLIPLPGQYSNQLFDPNQQQPEPQTNTLDTFILSVLKKPQDRIFLLKLEKDLEAFINNIHMNRLDLPQMNSYQRLMVHKVAPYFNLCHSYEPTRRSVSLYKGPYTAIPEMGFADLVEPEEKEQEESGPKITTIMRRASPGNSNGSRRGSPNGAGMDRKNLTYEERKAAYEEARARIFKDME